VNITKWDAGTWIAVAAAAIALFAAWASWRQAKAAKDQVAIMRRQLGNEEADRHKAAGPDFTTNPSIGYTEAGKPVASIGVTQVGGPEHSDVTVTVRAAGDVLGLIGTDGNTIVDSITWTDNAPGKVNKLTVSLKRGKAVDVVLDLKSVEAGTGKVWTCTKTTRPMPSMGIGTQKRRGRLRRQPEGIQGAQQPIDKAAR
jgi:hypothetical protein